MTTSHDQGAPARGWRKSSRSANVGACVEVNLSGQDRTLIRDTKAPEDGHLTIPGDQWSAFLRHVKHDAFTQQASE